MRAIHSLPRQFRETILLHYYQGLGIAEIAQMLGLPEGTISSRLSRARKTGKPFERRKQPVIDIKRLEHLARWRTRCSPVCMRMKR